VRGFLLDTNVLSELRRPKPDPGVLAFVAAQAEETLFVSDVTLAEIHFGIAKLADPERRAVVSAWLTKSVRPLFAGRLIALSEEIILRWRTMLEAGRRRGHTFGQLDLFIAATAAESDLVVVSRDVIHFISAAVPILDPWTDRFVNAQGYDRTIKPHEAGDLLS
jgi:predicted nucleic acid-binding protein